MNTILATAAQPVTDAVTVAAIALAMIVAGIGKRRLEWRPTDPRRRRRRRPKQ